MLKQHAPLARCLLLVLAAALALPVMAQEAGAKKSANTLYKRLGGYDKIAAIIDTFLNQLRGDDSFTKFVTGLADTSKRRNRQLIVDQVCELTGGPCVYIGRTMKQAHEGIPITEKDWDAAGKHMVTALEKNNVGPKERDEFMAIIAKLKDDIVAKEAGKK